MGQILHVKAAPINVRPALEVTPIAHLVKQVVQNQTANVMLEHTTMGQMLHAKAAPINVRPAQEVTPIAHLVQQVVLDLTVLVP